MKRRQAREGGTGRYTYDRNERLCVCGHTLGAHAAVRTKVSVAQARAQGRPEIAGRTFQDCMAADESESDEPCECECFKPSK